MGLIVDPLLSTRRLKLIDNNASSTCLIPEHINRSVSAFDLQITGTILIHVFSYRSGSILVDILSFQPMAFLGHQDCLVFVLK